jgi:hypothetical protein
MTTMSPTSRGLWHLLLTIMESLGPHGLADRWQCHFVDEDKQVLMLMMYLDLVQGGAPQGGQCAGRSGHSRWIPPRLMAELALFGS